MTRPWAKARSVAGVLGRVQQVWADRAARTPLVLAGVAVTCAAAGALSLALMPEPLKAVPGAPDEIAGLRLYYEAAFPTPGDEPLGRPVSVAVCGSRVYVADSVAGVVRVFDERGVPESVIGSGTLIAPAYVACDSERGAVYITDRKADALYRFEPASGTLRKVEPREKAAAAATAPASAREATAPPLAFAPLGVETDPSGAVYVTDVASRHRVLVMDARGVIEAEIGGERSAMESTGVAVALDFPNDVAVVGDEIWVSDSNNMRVVVFDRAGAFKRVVSLSGLVRGLTAVPAADGSKAVVAGVDTLGQAIVMWDASGTEVGRVGEAGVTAGRLQYPNDVAFSSDGTRLYVADTGNRRIQIWRVEPADAERPFGPQGDVDASNRAPYVGAALIAFFVAAASAVSSVSLRRRALLERELLAGSREEAPATGDQEA
ncbi:NHL repeat-containing protein [Coriobacteriia bacterium Es71-Z0120]|uniref:NHL repeat-containing protein n=1 Tax=Parvivirga hydrogeniphila TaxID=2939460 RepID=UPI00226095A7|nr:NHL repeat-containing protein [Parvivirga hydrogeniphila]MCL4079378.1 NHL repeat-containing protein [Parvivirga hydrogeniphila]